MDIRVIVGGKVINVSELSLEAQGVYVVGVGAEGNQRVVVRCKEEREAEEVMGRIIEEIRGAHRRKQRDILIEI